MRTYQTVDFAVATDHGMKIKGNEKRNESMYLASELIKH